MHEFGFRSRNTRAAHREAGVGVAAGAGAGALGETEGDKYPYDIYLSDSCMNNFSGMLDRGIKCDSILCSKSRDRSASRSPSASPAKPR